MPTCRLVTGSPGILSCKQKNSNEHRSLGMGAQTGGRPHQLVA